MLPLGHHVRLYCERTSASLWAEPFNDISNIGFFIAAWALWQLYRKNRSTPEIPTLVGLTCAIGAGSFIFHTVATIWSVFFDVIPILVFVIIYVYCFARRLLGFEKPASILLTLVLAVVNILYKYFVFRAIDGYVSYLPTFLFLLVLSLVLLLRHHASALRVTFASCVAFTSLYFRTMDRAWCGTIPIGTHFLWHLLNALLIYILVRELMLPPATDTASRISTP